MDVQSKRTPTEEFRVVKFFYYTDINELNEDRRDAFSRYLTGNRRLYRVQYLQKKDAFNEKEPWRTIVGDVADEHKAFSTKNVENFIKNNALQ